MTEHSSFGIGKLNTNDMIVFLKPSNLTADENNIYKDQGEDFALYGI